MAFINSALGADSQKLNAISGPPVSPLAEIGGTLDSARELALRVQRLANDVLGPTPEASGASAKADHSGSLGRVMQSATNASDDFGMAHRALTRLEQALA